MDILFIGSNPSNRAGSLEAFTCDTASGRILRGWIERAEISGNLYFDNVIPQKTKNNRPLTTAEKKGAQDSLYERISKINPDKIVALGKSSSFAMKQLGLNFLEMPHPSGLNRQLNDKEYVDRKIQELKRYCSTTLL